MLAGLVLAMPLPTSERAIVNIVDDDASLRRSLEELFHSVGLGTQTYASLLMARAMLRLLAPRQPFDPRAPRL
jgi:FixJ family two-component response regulator